MKRFFIICCLLAGTAGYTQAQTAATPPLDVAAPVSKTDFSAKVTELDNLLKDGKQSEAKAKFGQVTDLIHGELKVVRYKIRDAKSEAEAKTWSEYTQKQRLIYADIVKNANDMTNNRQALIGKLNEFAATII